MPTGPAVVEEAFMDGFTSSDLHGNKGQAPCAVITATGAPVISMHMKKIICAKKWPVGLLYRIGELMSIMT